MNNNYKVSRAVGIWLIIGLVMVFFQIVIGGITRLTDSGLSITDWEVIRGTLPPLNAEQWNEAFVKYKTHTKQAETLHAGMTLSEFKFIYFWEYFHRLWARTMGFVFLIPFLYFLWKRMIPRPLMKSLGIVVGLAALAAIFGWIMVASGLNTDDYIWVDAYKLTIHLSIAVTLMGVLWWTTLKVLQPQTLDTYNKRLRKFAWRITFVVILQLIFGGLMSGMKAGAAAPFFPHMGITEDGSWIWIADVLKQKQEWQWINMVRYYENTFAPSLVQLFHRGTAYLLCILIPIFSWNIFRIQASQRLKAANYILLSILAIQVSLGIFTLINSANVDAFVPLGVLHQAFGILLLLSMLFVNYQFSKGGYKKKTTTPTAVSKEKEASVEA